jgi:hypothetical protein
MEMTTKELIKAIGESNMDSEAKHDLMELLLDFECDHPSDNEEKTNGKR